MFWLKQMYQFPEQIFFLSKTKLKPIQGLHPVTPMPQAVDHDQQTVTGANQVL